MQEGDAWSGLCVARGPPAVADDSTDSPAGDSEGGGLQVGNRGGIPLFTFRNKVETER